MKPVQGGRLTKDGAVKVKPSEVPNWLAREAYEEYARIFGDDQSFERLHERGGFGPRELMDLLAGGTGNGTMLEALRATRSIPREQARKEAVEIALARARGITTDASWSERLAIVILQVSALFYRQGYRYDDIRTALRSLEDE